MDRVLSIGELVVEFFCENIDQNFYETGGRYIGPFPSGSPAIFIDTLGKLGMECGFIGTLGRDSYGNLILKKLKDDGVEVSGIKVLDNVSTGLAFTTYFKDNSRKFLYYIINEAPGRFNSELIEDDYVKTFNHLHISGNVLLFSESARKACLKTINVIKENGGRISFDPNIRVEMIGQNEGKKIRELFLSILKDSFILFPSKGEIEFITDQDNEINAVNYLFKNTKLKYIVIKKGGDGSTIWTADRYINVPVDEIEEVDATGAGDCFGGAFLYGILNNWDLEKTGEFANLIGRETVSVRGPMEGDFSEILRIYKDKT